LLELWEISKDCATDFLAIVHEVDHNLGQHMLGARIMPLGYFLHGGVIGNHDHLKTLLRTSDSPSIGNVLDEALAIFIDQATAEDLGLNEDGMRTTTILVTSRAAFSKEHSKNHANGVMIAEILHKNNINLETLPYVNCKT